MASAAHAADSDDVALIADSVAALLLVAGIEPGPAELATLTAMYPRLRTALGEIRCLPEFWDAAPAGRMVP